MQIELLVGHYDRMIGLAWYAASLQNYLSRIGVDFLVTQPDYPFPVRAAHILLQPFGYNLQAFFNLYPVSARLRAGTIKHFTTQQMASLLSFRKDIHPVIITVHDIIPYLMRDDPAQSDYRRLIDRWVDSLAMNNIDRADRIITVSSYTRQVLIDKLGIAPEKINVILHGLDLGVFKPACVSDEFRRLYHIDPECQYLLYVGSEMPRKNLESLLEAFANVKRHHPSARLIKIGSPSQLKSHQKLKEQIRKLGLQNEVILLDHISRGDLISFYNLADIFVFPSVYEGFGLPPLEAMACGAAVICSNSTSLPEVVGDSAISLDPMDVAGWAGAILDVLSNDELRKSLQVKSLARASQFSWERMAQETLAVYQDVATEAN